MEIESNIAKVAAKPSAIKEDLAHVLVQNDTIVATDGYKLVELKGKDSGTSALVPAKLLRKGDTITKTDDGRAQMQIIRKDGSVLFPDTKEAEIYPKYEELIKNAEERRSVSMLINRRHLIQLLEAIPDERVTMRVPFEKNNPLHITSNTARALLMPIRE